MFDDEMARNPNSSPSGPLDDRLDLKVPESMRRSLDSLASLGGYQSTGDYVRAVLTAHLYGHMTAAQKAYRHAVGLSSRGKDDE